MSCMLHVTCYRGVNSKNLFATAKKRQNLVIFNLFTQQNLKLCSSSSSPVVSVVFLFIIVIFFCSVETNTSP